MDVDVDVESGKWKVARFRISHEYGGHTIRYTAAENDMLQATSKNFTSLCVIEADFSSISSMRAEAVMC